MTARTHSSEWPPYTALRCPQLLHTPVDNAYKVSHSLAWVEAQAQAALCFAFGSHFRSYVARRILPRIILLIPSKRKLVLAHTFILQTEILTKNLNRGFLEAAMNYNLLTFGRKSLPLHDDVWQLDECDLAPRRNQKPANHKKAGFRAARRRLSADFICSVFHLPVFVRTSELLGKDRNPHARGMKANP